jgi:hypothetical protein
MLISSSKLAIKLETKIKIIFLGGDNLFEEITI